MAKWSIKGSYCPLPLLLIVFVLVFFAFGLQNAAIITLVILGIALAVIAAFVLWARRAVGRSLKHARAAFEQFSPGAREARRDRSGTDGHNHAAASMVIDIDARIVDDGTGVDQEHEYKHKHEHGTETETDEGRPHNAPHAARRAQDGPARHRLPAVRRKRP